MTHKKSKVTASDKVVLKQAEKITPNIKEPSGKQYICSQIQPRSKGTKVAIFHEIISEKITVNHEIVLYFTAEETCPYEVLEKYNLNMSVC